MNRVKISSKMAMLIAMFAMALTFTACGKISTVKKGKLEGCADYTVEEMINSNEDMLEKPKWSDTTINGIDYVNVSMIGKEEESNKLVNIVVQFWVKGKAIGLQSIKYNDESLDGLGLEKTLVGEMCKSARLSKAKTVFKDSRDGKEYKAYKIGEQVWMGQNLDFEAKDSKCYDDKPENCKKYGRLYNQETALSACPKDWHLPTKEEWDALENTVGDSLKTGKLLKAEKGWNNYKSGWSSYSGNGENEFGFAALPGGALNDKGKFIGVGTGGYWWSTTDSSANFAYRLCLANNYAKIYKDYREKTIMYSIRCVKGKAPKTEPAAKTEAVPAATEEAAAGEVKEEVPQKDDGFKNVKMPDGKVWMAENLNIEKGNSTCYESKAENCAKCGRLYDFETAKLICPKGWHLPSDAEWKALGDAAGSSAGTALKSKSGWEENGNGEDNYGFSALACGYLNTDGNFHNYGSSAHFWSATSKENAAWDRNLYADKTGMTRNSHNKAILFSVRCVKD